MWKDDRGNGGGSGRGPRNVFGERLEICSIQPMTGFFRDGCCDTGPEDIGSHTVCVVMTAEFLEFSKSSGNDLSTPIPEFGLIAGASALPAGKKHSRRARRRASCCAPRMKLR